MMHFDVVVIGSGPAGQKAAVQAAKSGLKACIVEQAARVGGNAIIAGTLPARVLRENALRMLHFRQNTALYPDRESPNLDMSALIDRMDNVLSTHDQMLESQTNRNLISRIPGRATLLNRYEVEVRRPMGEPVQLQARMILIATGTVAIAEDGIAIDHEHIYDTESILNLLYLPKSLLVHGSDMHACEYASTFQALGVKVTLVCAADMPLAHLDDDLRSQFVASFQGMGGRLERNARVLSAEWDGHAQVIAELDNGRRLAANKMLCAPARKANVEHLNLAAIGVKRTADGFVAVNEHYQTEISNIFAAGDVIGRPVSAGASMVQGRNAVCHAFRLPKSDEGRLMPTSVYTIPEISGVGMTERDARAQSRDVIVGHARFNEIVRGQITGNQQGFLKLISDASGDKILGVQILGEGAAELIHIGQMAILNNNSVDVFIDNVFNFPTLAEAYRVAALDVFGQRMKRSGAY